MEPNEQADTAAVLVGCAVVLLCGSVGAGLGFMLMPALPSGGYYGAIADALVALLLWCGLGFFLGTTAGACLAAKVASRLDRRKREP